MKKLTAFTAATLLVAMSALATPASAQAYHGDRDDDRHETRWGDHDRDHDRDGDHDRDDRHRGDRDDHRRWDHDRDDRYGRYDRDDRYDRYDRHSRYDRYDRRAYAPRVYRAPYAYVVPRGYALQRWRVGTRMPPPFYASGYYVDPYAYQLRLPPRGYRWVRVDHDAYMVSMASGIIADVLYGIFR